MTSFDRTPDTPQQFGYKVSWFAVKAPDPASVLHALKLAEATPSNWASGLAVVYSRSRESDPWVFVAPPVSGWVLAVSTSWPYPVAGEAPSQTEYQYDIGRKFDVLFSRLIKRFDDVQFFGSHRVSGFVTWARALNGEPVRIFAYADEVMANVGEQTAEEARLGLANLSGLSPSDASDRMFEIANEQDAEVERLIAGGLSRREALARLHQDSRDAIPNETDVTDLAAFWSINPAEALDQDDPTDLGLAVRLPKDLVQ